MRYLPLVFSILGIPIALLWYRVEPLGGFILFTISVLLSALGISDFCQKKSSVLKNYPLTARMRYLLESIRPEIRQYFLESDHDEVPFSREQRTLVYRRAKNMEGLRPFGTLKNVQQVGYEWINHSMIPTTIDDHGFRLNIGGPDCQQPYDSSVLNISGMSFGALSANAIQALNKGAEIGGFAHTTGEGSISRHHETHNGDLVWQIGSGYFGCRDEQGNFNEMQYSRNARKPQVKMIELKLSQGAKPGHGGILPGSKVSGDIAEARGVPTGVDCISPPKHSAFSNPIELLNFVSLLRKLSGGKPVGIKFCVGHPWEFFAIAKAMHDTGIMPDFITIDGSEGGTGAAPVEFADHIGAPIREGLMLVHNTLVGLGIRDSIRIIVAGKLISAFDLARMFALGADGCNMARGFMFALGCIQAQACHTGACPTGVASQNPGRSKALVVAQKQIRVANFHSNTLSALAETVIACGLHHPSDFTPHHLMIRINSQDVRSAASQHHWLEHGELLGSDISHPAFIKFWKRADPGSFSQAA